MFRNKEMLQYMFMGLAMIVMLILCPGHYRKLAFGDFTGAMQDNSQLPPPSPTFALSARKAAMVNGPDGVSGTSPLKH